MSFLFQFEQFYFLDQIGLGDSKVKICQQLVLKELSSSFPGYSSCGLCYLKGESKGDRTNVIFHHRRFEENSLFRTSKLHDLILKENIKTQKKYGVEKKNYFCSIIGFDYFSKACPDSFHYLNSNGLASTLETNCPSSKIDEVKKILEKNQIKLPSEILKNTVNVFENHAKGGDYMNYFLYTSLPLFHSRSSSKFFEIWSNLSHIYGVLNSKINAIDLKWTIDKQKLMLDILYKEEKFINEIEKESIGNIKTPKFHSMEHLIPVCWVFGALHTHSTLVGETFLGSLKNCASYSKRKKNF
jgi:hypothetical protein